jgi:hypothetical protein
MVTGEGGLPERPTPWAYERTTEGVTRSGVVCSKKRQSILEYDSTVRFEPLRLPFSTKKA